MRSKNQIVMALPSRSPSTTQIVFNLLFYGILFMGFIYAIGAFAQDVAPIIPAPSPVVTPPPGLEWLGAFIEWLSAIPKVGPVVVNVLKYVGAAAAIFTALSVAVSTVLKVPALVARWAGASAVAANIENFSASLKPFLDYFSIFNVQK